MAIHPDRSLFVTCDTSTATLVIDPHLRRIVDVGREPGHGGHFLALTAHGAKGLRVEQGYLIPQRHRHCCTPGEWATLTVLAPQEGGFMGSR